MAVAGGSWTAQGEAEVDEGRADSASEEQKDDAEEKDKSFQDVLSRYRRCPSPARWINLSLRKNVTRHPADSAEGIGLPVEGR